MPHHKANCTFVPLPARLEPTLDDLRAGETAVMNSDFEDHCWRDVVPADVLDVYSHYERKVFVGPSPALLVIDLYELPYQGGAKPPATLHREYPSSCGEYAYAAIEPTRRLFAAARTASLPIFYTTMDTRADSLPTRVTATKRRSVPRDPALYA